YQTIDGFPLAAEPFAAALDVVFEFVESGFTRRSIVGLLRSPHFAFPHEGRAVDAESVAALDRGLSGRRYLGGLDRLVDIAATWRDGEVARPAIAAACAAARRLSPLLSPAPASVGLRLLLAFIDTYGELRLKADATSDTADNGWSRLDRARAAVRASIESLADAHAAHDDPAVVIADLAATVRRFLEDQTLAPEPGGAGVQLVDDQAARYGEFDEMAIVGLIEGEWPERPRRNIFYPPSLLNSLGWPSEKDRRAAAEARFVELVASASHRVTVSTVTLEDDALVEASTFVDLIGRAQLTIDSSAGFKPDDPANLLEDILSVGPVGAIEAVALDPLAREWLAMRLARSSPEDPAFHGQTGPLESRPWSVNALETYLGCPFRFFAQRVLRLEEEPEDEEVMNPRARGEFVHGVFQAFFERWQAEGHRAITPDTLETARRIFAEVVDERLTALPDAEAALERTRLLGGPMATGLGETVLRMEAERPTEVIGRLLEHRLDGEFVFQTDQGPRRLALRGKADRVDLLADGTFRLIDYKLGWPPHPATALQLPVYGLCLEQSLRGYQGRTWTLGEAAYLAFRGPKRIVRLPADPGDRENTLAAAQNRLVATVDGISRGDFPPRPDDVFRCETCSYSAVCRQDYVGDV
ncbi:MAG: PD-(D/E)XK nuclease family protein, partial [Vicinamibacterales bacterium]